MATTNDHAGLVAMERASLAQLFHSLSDTEKRVPSLCDGWSVRDVACHVASAQRTGLWRALAGLLASGLSPDRLNAREVGRWRSRPDAEIAAAIGEPRLAGLFRLSPAAALAEIVLHQQDVRRPLARERAYTAECLTAVLDATSTATTGTGSKRRARGLALRATDVAWSRGSGPEVAGPAEALIMALNGRRAALAGLHGAGVAVLRERLGERIATGAAGTADP